MSPFIETIKVFDGEVDNLSFHQSRFERTRSEMLGFKSHPALEEKIIIPANAREGLFKCRILYDHREIGLEFQKYERPGIKSLKLVSDNGISYSYKSVDRSALTALYNLRGSCDDILIVKNGEITDSYFANVVLWDGFQWFTPEKPLLEGCMRASLLENGIIKTASIRIESLPRFQSLKLINALNHLNDAPLIPMEAVTR
jgi:4-amino-4-deoxychorismate lyase